MSMDTDKRDVDPSVQYHENAPRRTKRSRACAHLKKFWWAYLLFAICAVALIVPLVIFVGVKNMAQHKLNKARLEVQGFSVTNTQTQNFTMSVNSTITGDNSVKATVEEFDGNMYLEDEPSHTPFAVLRFPTTVNQDFQVVNITNQFIHVVDVHALTTFNAWLLSNTSVRVTVEGHPKIKVPHIGHKYNAHFKKTITLQGLQNFAGITFANSSISASTFPDGTNFHSTITIPNRSLFRFEIGNATFVNYLNDSAVGHSFLNNLVLSPGNNTLHFTANISQGPVLQAVSTQPVCKTGMVPFLMNGREVFNHGQPLPYFADALATANDSITIDLDTPLRALGLDPKCP